MAEVGDWLRGRGIGRERLVGHIADFLTATGYTIERAETGEPAESRVVAQLTRMNPSVPPGAHSLAFRIYPTAGGAAITWLEPTSVPDGEWSRMDRFEREFSQHLERVVLTASHASARLVRPPTSRLPWRPPPAATAV